jgi:hypothetical protein
MELLCEEDPHHSNSSSKSWHIIPVATLPMLRRLGKAKQHHAPINQRTRHRATNVIIPYDPAALDVQHQNAATMNGNSCNMSVIPETDIDDSEEYMGYMDLRQRRSLEVPKSNAADVQRRRWSFDDSQVAGPVRA